MAGYIKGAISYIPGFRSTSVDPSVAEVEQENKELNEELAKNSTGSGDGKDDIANPDDIKEEDVAELPSDKKTDEVFDPSQQPGYIRRFGSGLYGAASGTIGYGVGGVKWVAGTGYNATATVVGTTKNVIAKVPLPTLRKKDHKD